MLSDLGTDGPLEIRLRIWSEDVTRLQIVEGARVVASGEVPRILALDAHASWDAARSRWSGDPATLREVGDALTAVVPPSIGAALQETIGCGLTEGRPVRLRIDCDDSDLCDVPWEWLFLRPATPLDPAEGPLALVPNVRVWRESSGTTILEGGELRVLVVVADPGSPRFPRLPWLSTEAKSIASTFALSRRRGIELRTMTEVLPASLENEITEFRPHVLHFSGHGESRPGGGVLVLNGPRPNSDRLLSAGQLAIWLAEAGTQLAFLSACDTAGSENSVARTLVDSGIPNVVAMQTPIPDAAQPHFARIFYGSLLSGASVDEAVAEARQASGGTSTAWASAVLYASSTPLSLFAAPREPHVTRVPNNLPIFDSPIVARDAEIDEILRLLRDTRMVVLVGPGGIGKTRLAVEAAALALDGYPDGVWEVECDACASAEDVLFAIIRTLGIERDERTAAECVADHLAGRRTLLVLDSLEGVVATGGQTVVARLLEATSASLLVTSRFRLGFEDERIVEIHPLHDGLGLLLQISGLAGRKLGDEERRTLIEICKALEGVPLALMIAAGRLRFLQVDQLAELLRESPLSTLGGRKSDVSVAIRRSLDLISEEDRGLLRDLAVFAGAFSWDDVAEVYPDDRFEMLEGLSRLVDRSLLQPENAGDHRRYRTLDSLREYLATLPQPEGERARNLRGRASHLELFASRAKTIADLLGQGRWVEGTSALWDALPNLRVALDFAIQAHRADEAETLCRSLARTLMEAGMWHDFERIAASAYLVAEKADRPRLASYLMSLEGAMRSRRGDAEGAERVWRQRVELCRRIGSNVAAADGLVDLAAQAIEAGRMEEAGRLIDEAIAEAGATDRTDLRTNLATVRFRYYDALGDGARASECAGEAEALVGPDSSADETIFVYTNLARVWRQRKDHRRVRRAMEGILRVAVAGERRTQAAVALTELARTLREENYANLADRCLVAAIAIFRELGSHRLRAAERQYAEHRQGEVQGGSVAGRSWKAQIDSILDYLAALSSEES